MLLDVFAATRGGDGNFLNLIAGHILFPRLSPTRRCRPRRHPEWPPLHRITSSLAACARCSTCWNRSVARSLGSVLATLFPFRQSRRSPTIGAIPCYYISNWYGRIFHWRQLQCGCHAESAAFVGLCHAGATADGSARSNCGILVRTFNGDTA